MLFKQDILAKIASGKVDLAYRRWMRPSAKAGGTQLTSIGLIQFDSVDRISMAEITDADTHRAGFTSRDKLIDELKSFHKFGRIYRIALRLAGPDPRIALREKSKLTKEDIEHLRTRLARLDAASSHGPWTMHGRKLIERHPAVRATELARKMNREKQSFKLDVRKLKKLGLTISLHPGYRLSPRGKALLKHLEKRT